jgi:cell division septum initiation protein DivIVA
MFGRLGLFLDKASTAATRAINTAAQPAGPTPEQLAHEAEKAEEVEKAEAESAEEAERAEAKRAEAMASLSKCRAHPNNDLECCCTQVSSLTQMATAHPLPLLHI